MGLSWLRIKTVIRRHAYVLWRAPHRWFDIAFWPIMDCILWGSLGTYVATQDEGSGAATPFLLGGIMMFHVIFQSQIAVATGFMEETWSRNLLNVVTTPVKEVEYVLGTALFGFVKVVGAMTALSLTAAVFFGFDLRAVGWALVPIVAILTVVGWGLGIANIGIVLRFGQGAEILIWGSNFIIMAFSGVFNPVDALPGALQPISRILPSTYAFDGLRTVLDGGSLSADVVVKGLVGAALFLVGGVWFTTSMLRTFRRRGFVTRFS
jgi:ABC-2 type transport system permease protein